MLKIRTFKIDDYDGFNKFTEKFSPRGENGLRFTTNNIIVTYEDGDMMTKTEKIQKLKFELGRHLEHQFQYDKQLRTAKKMRDSFPKDGNKWKETNMQYQATIGMLKIEIMDTEVVVEMLAEFGEKVHVEYAILPQFEKEELIPSDIHNDKGRAD